jgi:hypothetical protein
VRGFTITKGTRGIYLTAGAPTIADNRITANRGTLQGAGLFMSWSNAAFNPLVTGNEIDGNVHRGDSASGYRYGGGIYVSSTNAAARPEFCFNYIHDDTVHVMHHSYCRGGGIWAEGGVLIWGNVVSANVCKGTGVSPWGNYTYGGGIYLTSSGANAVPVVFGNLIIGNRSEANSYAFGGGIYNNCNSSAGNALVLGNTVAGNVSASTNFPQGGGFYNTSNCKATLQNNIIAGNSAGSGSGIYNSTTGTTLLLSYNDYYNNALYGCTPGTGDITSDPQFVSGGWRLSQVAAGQPSTSPCVDAGSALPAGTGLNLDSLVHAWTTRTDDVPDAGAADIGYHYVPVAPLDDVGCSHLLAPSGTVDSGAVVTPACSTRNYGSSAASYWVRMRIEPSYLESAYVTSQPAGSSSYVTFADWTAAQRGTFGVTCSTELTGDANNANDKATGTVDVQVVDVGCTHLLAPSGTFDLGAVATPACSVYNFGTTTPASYDVRMVIGAAYNMTVTVAGPAPGERVYVTFPDWTASELGDLAISCCTELSGDANPGNNCSYGSVTVLDTTGAPPGWTEVAQVPLSPSGKAVKDGGWLVEDGGRLYVAKGYKTGDFYYYRPDSLAWQELASWPPGGEAKPPYKGSVGCVGDHGYVYATKGNNTVGFWRYDPGTNSWEQLADVPLGLSNKKVKGGTDMVYVRGRGQDTAYVYLLKGYKAEFYRFNTENLTWQTLPEAPIGAKPKWDKGSWLVTQRFGNDSTLLYAHKAKYHEFYTFSTSTLTWSTTSLTGMPFPSGLTGKSKKSKDGGSAAVYDDAIWALKGGNTCEFWQYDLELGTWAEKETMPQVGSAAKKKRVKAGGDIVESGDYLYALKGNKTLELWRYVPSTLYAGRNTRYARTGVQSVERAASGVTLLVQNPSRGRATIRLSGPLTRSPYPSILSLYDASGRLVLSRSLELSVSRSLSLPALSPGVYLVRVTGGANLARKLVIE